LILQNILERAPQEALYLQVRVLPFHYSARFPKAGVHLRVGLEVEAYGYAWKDALSVLAQTRLRGIPVVHRGLLTPYYN
jgi:hypothetical protein